MVGLLMWATVSSATIWIAAGDGGSQGHPGTRHGINVGGFAPVRGGGLAVFPLLYSDNTAPSAPNADLFVRAEGPLDVDTELRHALVTLTVGSFGPDPVSNAVLNITVSPVPTSVNWTCFGSAGQCVSWGSGGVIGGIALADTESVQIELDVDFDASAPMPDFQVGVMVDSELEDFLPMDNALTLSWTDVMFSDGFE